MVFIGLLLRVSPLDSISHFPHPCSSWGLALDVFGLDLSIQPGLSRCLGCFGLEHPASGLVELSKVLSELGNFLREGLAQILKFFAAEDIAGCPSDGLLSFDLFPLAEDSVSALLHFNALHYPSCFPTPYDCGQICLKLPHLPHCHLVILFSHVASEKGLNFCCTEMDELALKQLFLGFPWL